MKTTITLILITCLLLTQPLISQITPKATKTIQLSPNSKNPKIQQTTAQTIQQKQTLINSFKINGKPSPMKNPKGNFTISNKTERNGRVIEVLPYNGSTLGVSEQRDRAQNQPPSDGRVCTTQQVALTAGFNELTIMDPSAAEIWPGRIINISTMDEGTYQSFTDFTSRNDLKIMMVSAGTSQGNVLRTITGSNITQGSVTNEVNDIKNSFGNNDFGSDTWMFEQIEYSSMEQFALQAGLGVTAVPINLDIRASGGVSSGAEKNKVVIKFLRKAYDIKVDNDLADVVQASNLSNNAGIVAIVSYGSFGIIEIESDSSYSTISATLNAAFQADPTTAIDTHMSLSQKNTMRNFSIKGIFKGVAGNQSIQNNLSLDALRRMLSGGIANFTATTPVVPISFVIKSLKTGETMMLRTTMSYPKIECTILPEAPADLKVRLKMVAFTCPKVNDGFSDDEDIYGEITVTCNEPSKSKIVWDKSVSQNVKVKKSERPNEDGAYSLNGRADDFLFTMKTDATSLANNSIKVKVKLCDEEWEKCVAYETRSIIIKHKDIFQAIKSRHNFTGNDNWDSAQKKFKLITNETKNTNKIILWFDVIED